MPILEASFHAASILGHSAPFGFMAGGYCSLMAPDDDEIEEHRGILASVEYRTEFEPRTISLNESATFTATINIPESFEDGGSGEQLWRLTVEASSMSPRSRLLSMMIAFTAPRRSANRSA